MDHVELTRGSIWLALAFYVAAEWSSRIGIGRTVVPPARWLNSCGWFAFCAHVVCAFQFYHHWSHAAAYADTARQSGELTGWNWGGGLWINYLFGLVWLGEVLWSWVSATRYVARPNWMRWGVRSFFFFMIFNGAVVFAHGPSKWLGTILCLGLTWIWWTGRTRGAAAPGAIQGR